MQTIINNYKLIIPDLFQELLLNANMMNEKTRNQVIKYFPTNVLKIGNNMFINRLARIISGKNFDITEKQPIATMKKLFLY